MTWKTLWPFSNPTFISGVFPSLLCGGRGSRGNSNNNKVQSKCSWCNVAVLKMGRHLQKSINIHPTSACLFPAALIWKEQKEQSQSLYFKPVFSLLWENYKLKWEKKDSVPNNKTSNSFTQKISYTMNNNLNTKLLKSAFSVNLNDLFLYKMTWCQNIRATL